MSSISFTAHGRCARATVCEPITTGSVGLSVSFAFDAAWSGLQKTAIFRGSGMAVDLVLSGDAATVPPEVLTIPGGDLRVGVWGADPEGNVITPTVWATVGEIVPGAAPSGFDPDPPTPSWAAQVQEIAQDALDTANSVREDADAGEFDGATYTPAVSAGGDLSWTNDKGKPNPPTVNIKGPEGQPGQTGATPDISIGTVETLPPGSPATATMTGTAENPVLSFGIPQGQQGAPGEVTQAEFDDLADEVTRQKSAFEAHEQYAEETYAKQDGSYEDLTAGNAYELLSDRGDTNQQPYLFRQTGGDSSAYNREQLKKIVGGTVAWNQLYGKTGNVTSNGITYTNTNGRIRVTGVANGTSYYTYNVSIPANHVVLVGGAPDGGSSTTYDMTLTNTAENTPIYGGYSVAKKSGNYGMFNIDIRNGYDADANPLTFVPQLFDLTQMFGTAIADYIYSLEQATAGAGVAFFRSLFPADYYDYNPGELMSVEGVSAHETVGFNQWDEEWELGVYATSTGNPIASGSNIRSKSTNYISVLPSTAYYFKTAGYLMEVYQYRADKSYIGKFNVTNEVYTMHAECHYIRFDVGGSYGTTYKHDICINISDPARNGTYEPYKNRTYPLDSSLTLRGIPKLDSNNRLYYDGDTYEPDGTVTRKYGIVDLGTLNFGAASAYGNLFRANASLPDALNDYPTFGRLVDCRCVELEHSLYVADAPDRAVANTYGIRYNNIYVCFSESKTRAEVLAAMSGILLVYPLLTPTTETAEPYRELEICDRDGTEEFVSTSIVPVGHETFYPVNVFDYIDRLTEPDADMIADSAIAANKYFSVGNRLFLSTASIAAGAMIIPGTNCQETSLAAALNALNA